MKGLSSGLVIGLTILLVFAACLAVLVAFLFVRRSRRAQIERNLSFVDTTTSTIDSLNVDLEKLKSADSNFSGSSLKLASPYASVNSVGTGLTLFSNEAFIHGDDPSTNRSIKSGRSHGLPSSPSSPRKSKMYHHQAANAPRPNGLPSSPRKSKLNVTIPIPNHQTPSIRRLSSQEILAHHTANGTMTRPFAPLPPTTSDPDVTTTTPAGSPYIHQNLTTAQISRSSITTNRRRSSLYLSTSAGEGDPNIDDLNLSSISIVSEASSARVQQQRPQPNVLKVRTIFTPLLPDELVLRPNEKLTLIKNCSDGWCIVGRKSPFYVPSPVRKEFGQRNTERPDEIEIGAVPAWVFENNNNGNGKENVPGERPLRSESLSVVITMGDDDEVGQREKEKGKERKDVISWSNVY